MTSLHYLNVGAGDCTLIQHDSGRISMVDICGGNLPRASPLDTLFKNLVVGNLGLSPPAGSGAASEFGRALAGLQPARPPRAPSLFGGLGLASSSPLGNFNMRSERSNPLDYLEARGIRTLDRFISTHPDMDHLDGLDALFREVSVLNFWHTGVHRHDPDFATGSPYREQDWRRYRALQHGYVVGTRTLMKRAHSQFPLANLNEDGTYGGDRLFILSPDEGLVRVAERTDDLNDASYVLLMMTPAGAVILPGDAHDDPWDFVLRHYLDLVRNCALLIAPHHGRDSDRDYTFLDVLRPRLTLMGCAPAQYMGYNSWRRRGLKFFTNNQAGTIRVDIDGAFLSVWVENQSFAAAAGHDLSIRDAEGFTGVGLY